MSEHVGIGPDGANLLGFLASVGTLATLTRAWPERNLRMSWKAKEGWRPVWHVDGASTDAEVVGALDQALRGRQSRPEFTFADDLGVTPEAFAQLAGSVASAATRTERASADFVVAFGCEAVLDEDHVQDTAFRTMSGAGHQHFVRSMRELAEKTEGHHLGAALFARWRYEDERPAMRWDPVDDRRYAYRADDPAASRQQHPIRTVRGANRLAIEALPCFPTVPRGRRVYTTGFVPRVSEWLVRWPIWTPPLTLPTVRSLLTHPGIISPQPASEALRALGIIEVFTAKRFTNGRFRNFAPAEPLLGRGLPRQ